MRAVVIEDQQVRLQERPDPVPGEGQLLVRVDAAGLNGADLLQRAGFYPAPPDAPADIPGMECAGTVVACGPGTERHRVGDRVMSIVGGGAQAELCLVHDAVAIAVPENVDAHAAGGFPEVFTTAHDALFTQCGLTSGERVLVSGAAGGVGLAGVQLARQAGADVVASVRSEALRAKVAAFGATVVAPAEAKDAGPYDVILELVGAPNMAANLGALVTGGRIVVIGVGGGSKAEIDLLSIMSKRATVRGSTLRARSVEEKSATARALEADTLPLLASGAITVPVDSVFRGEDVGAAYDRFAAGGKLGKIVLDFTDK